MTFLVPGVGAQGGDLEACLHRGLDAAGGGLIINVSRQVLYASQGEDFAAAAREIALGLRDRNPPVAGGGAIRAGLAMVVEFRLGDVVRLRKVHPCGGYEWRVVRLGADIGLRCLTCGRRVLLDRRTLEKRLKAFAERGEEPESSPGPPSLGGEGAVLGAAEGRSSWRKPGLRS